MDMAGFTPGSAPAMEAFFFPLKNDCRHCGQHLQVEEARWGTGLCDTCYTKCEKECKICCNTLHRKELIYASGLCNRCFDNCEKNCRMCASSLQKQLHWGT